MIIEQAILQKAVVGRGGQTRQYQRPREVRDIAKRLHTWKRAPEGCTVCRREAHVIRSGQAFCVVCHENQEARGIVVPIGTLPFKERRADDFSAQGIVGTFIVFNSESVDLGGFVEVIKPQAVDRSMKDGDIRGLWGHDTSIVLGRRSAGTLSVEKQRDGLFGAITPPSWASNYVETVKRGDVSNASFAFSVIEDIWHFMRDEDKVLREIVDMTIFEISGVSFPAYPKTRIRVEDLAKRREMETLSRLRLAR